MIQKIEFENHLTLRVMEILFPQGLKLSTKSDLAELKAAWVGNLKTWHSPYTCLLDCRDLEIGIEVQEDFLKLLKFFSQFFLKKIIGFGPISKPLEFLLPFDVFESYELATKETGLGREGGLVRDLTDLRGRIQIENDFSANVLDIQFLAPTDLETEADIQVLKSKLINLLKQWHSPYSVLINCHNLTFSDVARQSFLKLEKFLQAFFCKRVIGYAPKIEKETYPFLTYRSRHLAAAAVQGSSLESGAIANCSTRKILPQS